MLEYKIPKGDDGMSHEELLLREYKFISKVLNKKYNQLMLADTEQEEQSLLMDIKQLEQQYKRVSHELDTLYE